MRVLARPIKSAKSLKRREFFILASTFGGGEEPRVSVSLADTLVSLTQTNGDRPFELNPSLHDADDCYDMMDV
jgi:hypothetical protein